MGYLYGISVQSHRIHGEGEVIDILAVQNKPHPNIKTTKLVSKKAFIRKKW